MQFSGFSPEAVQFFKDLNDNNNREWFGENKELYKLQVEQAFANLVESISPAMLQIDALFEVTAKVGKTISRIYRDVRFSKDKSPYRCNTWLSFKRDSKQWKEYPGYYFELSADYYTYGMGCYQATKSTMDNLRLKIEEEPEQVLEIINYLAENTGFQIAGEKYKRILNPNIQEPLLSIYQMKNIYLWRQMPIDDSIYNGEIQDILIEEFLKTSEFYNFLNEIVAV